MAVQLVGKTTSQYSLSPRIQDRMSPRKRNTSPHNGLLESSRRAITPMRVGITTETSLHNLNMSPSDYKEVSKNTTVH